VRLTGYLSSTSTPNLGLGILQQLHKSRDQIPPHDLLIDRFRDPLESIGNHIPHPPTLILEQTPQSSQKHSVATLLLLRHRLGNSNQNIHRQQPHRILIIARQMLKQRYHLLNHNTRRHTLHELREMRRGLSPDHRRVIVDELGELLTEAFLGLRGSVLVGLVVETCGGDFGGEPVGFAEADGEGDEVLFDLGLGELGTDFV